MADKSKIEWTDATWTPIRARRRDTGKVGVHCERVSEACKNCYAATFNQRNLPAHGTGLDFVLPNREKVNIFVDEDMLMAPLRWKRPRRIFVCSQTDLFGEFVAAEMIDQVFAMMALCPQHTFQVLTKRPERMMQMIVGTERRPDNSLHFLAGEVSLYTGRPGRFFPRSNLPWNATPAKWPLPNVWLGVTAENQARADERIPVLLQTPAAKRFVSFEPMLGPIDAGFNRWVKITRAVRGDFPIGHNHVVQPGIYRADANKHGALSVNGLGIKPGEYELLPSLDWSICGGESGPGARPMHPDWARSLRDQCKAAGVPFHFKQWGAWQNGSDEAWQGKIVLNDGRRGETPESFDLDTRNNWPDFRPCQMAFVGKNRAGRLLDGREWSEFPEEVRCGN